MQQHDLIQGTPEWRLFRAQHFTASDAPAMLGVSPYKSRTELLREKATGITAEVDAATQRRFDDGHRFEALARPLAEEILDGEGLFPCVGSEGRLAASFDGLTMLDDTCWEHKTLNDSLRGITCAADLPEHFRIQMEQQLMVSGASRCMFMATRWNDDDTLAEPPLVVWYESDLSLATRIADGWAQFEKDLAGFKHIEEAPAAIGRAPEALPALRIEVTGMVTASNLTEFKAHALAVFDGIKTDLQTDEDFANAEKTVKWCGDVEERLDAAKQHALSQTASIDELFRAIDAIKEEARQKRLTLEKLVKARKESIRIEIAKAAQDEMIAHVAAMNKRLGSDLMPSLAWPFADAMKGKKTISSLRDAVAIALASAKIEANAIADRIQQNQQMLKGDGFDHSHLFPDFRTVCTKEPVDFDALLTARQAKERERQEEERERIRKEEAEKLAAQQAAQPAPAPALQPVTEIAQPVQVAAISKPRGTPSLRLGAINDRLGFSVTADFLSRLGFAPHSEGASKLYHDDDFPMICRAIVQHINEVAANQMKRAA